MSGRSADLGVAGRNGAMLAVEQRNASGGIHGRPVALVVRDDEQNPAVADLLNQNIELIIGPMTSSIAMAVLDQVNASKSILLSPTVTTTALTGKDDNFMQVTGDTASYATKIARYQVQKFGRRTVAVIYDQDNRSYTESWLRDFKREFELHARDILLARMVSAPVITVTAQQVQGMVVILLEDNGGGISDDIIDKIFDPYFTTKHKAQGTGLGLYISKKIIEESFNGTIEVETCPDGTCFRIVVPMQPAEMQQDSA